MCKMRLDFLILFHKMSLQFSEEMSEVAILFPPVKTFPA